MPATANRVRIALKMPLVLEDKQAAESALDPRILGERSYQAGFLKDAQRYFLQAHEDNPVDASIELKLGWTYNMLHDDEDALYWFNLARRSMDSSISTEAAARMPTCAPASNDFARRSGFPRCTPPAGAICSDTGRSRPNSD